MVSNQQYKHDMQDYVGKHEKYLVPMPGFTPVIMAEAKGSILKDIEGKQYIDFVSQTAGTAGVGSCHPKVVEAVKKQVEILPHTSSWVASIPKIELAEKLARITPPKLKKSHFLCGGGEAVEFALHNAMRITKRQEIISLYLAYHGATIAALSLGQSWHRKGLPTVPGFRQIPPAYCYRCFYGKEYPGCGFECARALENAVRYGTHGNVAGFIMEPLLGNGGHITPPSKEYFKIIREICNKYGIFLIFDEIQTGFGRTGEMWASDYFEVQPDIMVIGKGMGGGMPISAAVFREDMKFPSESDQEIISTFSGSPVLCAAASAVIDIVLEEKLPERAKKMGAFMMEKLNLMKEKHPLIGEIRGAGLFIGIELVKDRKTKEKATEEVLRVIKGCRQKGLILLLSNKADIGNVLLIKPPMNISENLVSKGLNILDETIGEVESQ